MASSSSPVYGAYLLFSLQKPQFDEELSPYLPQTILVYLTKKGCSRGEWGHINMLLKEDAASGPTAILQEVPP